MKSLVLVGILSVSLAQAQDICSIRVNTSQVGARKVYLAGGNAQKLFELYLSELKKKNIKVDPKNIEVYLWDGSKEQVHKLGWGALLTGEPAQEIWRKRLQNIEAKVNEKELAKAGQFGMDIICISDKPNIATEKSATSTSEKQTYKKEECSQEAKGLIRMGLSFVKAREFNNAIREFDGAVKDSPKCALAWGNLISAHVSKGNYNIAIEKYKEALSKAGDDPFIHLTGSIAYAKKGDLDLALEGLSKSLDLGLKEKYKDINLPELLAGQDYKTLREKRRKDFCHIMSLHAISLKECIR